MSEWEKDAKVIAGASMGPWEARHADGLSAICHASGWVLESDSETQDVKDAEFIVRARTRWPAALEEIARLRKVLREIAEGDHSLFTSTSNCDCPFVAESALHGNV